MEITIHTTVLPHTDPEASLAFYRDTLGFEVRGDVGDGTMRWITVGPADQPETCILLAPPAVDPGITDDERRTVAEMMAKGTYGWIMLATKDLDGAFERVQAGDAEVVQEPTEQPWGAARLRLPRSCRQHGPHSRAELSPPDNQRGDRMMPTKKATQKASQEEHHERQVQRVHRRRTSRDKGASTRAQGRSEPGER